MRVLSAVMCAALVAVTAVSAAAEPAIHVPGVSTPWPGKIFVAHDEWALSDYGYDMSAPSARQLSLNLATWFTGGRPGRFLVYSASYGLVGHDIAATMAAAGHSWTVDAALPFTLASLLQYDAVFVGGGPVPDNGVLIDYVRAGGGVVVEGGTGLGGDPFEARHWNEFLEAFGLAFGDHYDLTRAPGIYPVQSSSPLLAGVTALYEDTGNPIFKLDARDPNVTILVPYAGHGLFATYSGHVVPVALEICQTLSTVGDGRLSVSVAGAPDFDVRALDLASVRVLNVAPFIGSFNYSSLAPRGRRLGRLAPDTCQPGSDRWLDVVFGFHSRDLLRAAEATLGHALSDGDQVALTLTGRLKREFGGTPIVGESVVVVKGASRPALRPR
jgi:hypothetical protein